MRQLRRVREAKLLYADTLETITALMNEHGVSQRELARRLGRSEAWISRVLNARGNTTVKTIADLGWALGVRFTLAPEAIVERDETPAEADERLPTWVERRGVGQRRRR